MQEARSHGPRGVGAIRQSLAGDVTKRLRDAERRAIAMNRGTRVIATTSVTTREEVREATLRRMRNAGMDTTEQERRYAEEDAAAARTAARRAAAAKAFARQLRTRQLRTAYPELSTLHHLSPFAPLC